MRLLTVKINNHTVTHGATALCVCARFDVTSWIIQHALGAGDGFLCAYLFAIPHPRKEVVIL